MGELQVFSVTEAHRSVMQEIEYDFSRESFYRWRKFLGLLDYPYRKSQVIYLSIFGQFIKHGASLQRAKQKTDEYIRSL